MLSPSPGTSLRLRVLRCCLWLSHWVTVLSTAVERAGSSTRLPTFGEDRVFNGTSSRYLVSVEAAGARCAIPADFDGDGRMDLVVASSSDNSVAWYRRLPDGGYSTKQMISRASNGARIVAVGDIDQDGLTDVVSASYYDHTVRWFRNLGGSFGPAQVITTSAIGAQGVSVVDIDNDGDLDVLSASSGDNTIAWHENLGEEGRFCEVRRLVDGASIGVRTVIAADLDRDGLPDLAAASKDDNTIAWYRNLGGGHFQKIVIDSLAQGAYSLVAMDINNDGVVDLVTASNMEGVTEESGEGGKVSFYRNDFLTSGSATFTKVAVTAEDDFDYFVLSVWAGDLDGDGDVDIASASFGLVHYGSISWYENMDGAGLQWQRHRIYEPSVFHAGHYIFGADMDADGDTDLVAVTHGDNKVQILYASTSCDESVNNAPSADCCPLEHFWNGTSCARCPSGTYYEEQASRCVPCPTACPRAGLAYLPSACWSVPSCGDVNAAYKGCDCEPGSRLDHKTSFCTACPAGYMLPRTRNRTSLDFQLQTVTAADGSSSIQSDMSWEAFNASQDCRAPDCQAGMHFAADHGQCVNCPAGFFSTGGAASACSVCPAGHSCPASSSGPTPCLPGYYAGVGAEACAPSLAGFHVPTSRMAEPVLCPRGYISVEEAASQCQPCAVASFNSQEGQTACALCGTGKAAPQLWTTMRQLRDSNDQLQWVLSEGSQSNESCGCVPGSRPQATAGHQQCVLCTEGMECIGLDVSIQEGYYASADLSVYRCHGELKRCAGGPPGQVCADGRTGLTCAECLDDMTPGADGKCKSCSGGDRGVFAVVVLAFVALVTAGYHLVDTHNRVTQSHSLLLCAFALSQLTTVTQQLGVVGRMSVQWEEPLTSFFQLFNLLSFDIEVLRLNCVSSVAPVTQYLLKVAAILFCVPLVTAVHCIYVACRHHGKFAARIPVLCGAIGTLFMVFYISVTSNVLEPLQCQGHPNGKWTVRGYQSILCWESREHTVMLILSCMAFLMVPVAFLAVAAKVVREHPRRMQHGDDKFLKTFAFFFFRFRAQRHQYVLVHLIRSFLLSMVLIIPDSILQIVCLAAILIAGCGATCYWLPWRVMSANAMDFLFGAFTLLIVLLGGLYVPDAEKNLHGVGVVAVVSFGLVLLLVPVAFIVGLWRKYMRQTKPFDFFLCHHKAVSGAWTRLLKVFLLESGKIRREVFVDSDNLDNLDFLFDYVGSDTRTFVIVGTQDIYTRSWCVGEICAAYLKLVPSVVVALPSYVCLDEVYIEELNEHLLNMKVLIENGMTIGLLQESLHWVATKPHLRTPREFNAPAMVDIVNKLTSKEPGGRVSSRRASIVTTAAVVQLYDSTNAEAGATTLILQKMVAEYLVGDPENIPFPFDGPAAINTTTRMVLVICSTGVFERSSVLQACLAIADVQPVLLPIMTEVMFQIPKHDVNQHLSLRGYLRLSDTEDPTVINNVVACIFKEIGVTFEASCASMAVLHASASQIAKRIHLATTARSRPISILPYQHHTSHTHTHPSASASGGDVITDLVPIGFKDQADMDDPFAYTTVSTAPNMTESNMAEVPEELESESGPFEPQVSGSVLLRTLLRL